jgi:hypothetical protein
MESHFYFKLTGKPPGRVAWQHGTCGPVLLSLPRFAERPTRSGGGDVSARIGPRNTTKSRLFKPCSQQSRLQPEKLAVRFEGTRSASGRNLVFAG